MNSRHPKIGGMVFVLLLASLACSTALPEPTPTVDFGATAKVQELIVEQTEAALHATSAALSESLTKAAASPTPAPTETPIPTATATPGPLVIRDDFSQDVGRWIGCAECAIENGALIMGPYPSVDSAEGYYAICKDCGVVDDYKVEVDVNYISGASDRGFGLLVWETDGYFIDLEITTWQTYGMWFYDKSKGNGWDAWFYVMDKPYMNSGSIRPGRLTNHLAIEVTRQGDKRMAAITINGKQLQSIDLKTGPGQIGLMVGLHSLGISFDNFYFEGLPMKTPRSSGDNG